MRQIVVTAAVVYDEAGRILITQRRPGAHAGLLWEFPGGRLECGEHPWDGLQRELQEELGIAVTGLQLYDVVSHIYAETQLHVVLLVYKCHLATGAPQPLECHDLAWLYPHEFDRYRFAAADVPIAARLQAEAGGGR